MPNNEHFEIVNTNRILTKRARHQRKVLQQFTSQWQREYLLNLRENAACKSKAKTSCNSANISVGDIVVVKSDSTKRAFWKLARVEELLISKDGKIRAARVKVANSERNPTCIRRVIQHLIPLEIASSNEVSTETVEEPPKAEEPSEIKDENRESTNDARPRRRAAVQGEALRRLLTV